MNLVGCLGTKIGTRLALLGGLRGKGLEVKVPGMSVRIEAGGAIRWYGYVWKGWAMAGVGVLLFIGNKNYF
jgi:hypothetical protein